ncbi:MAG: NAD(P)-dependent alcohol dehydrogenase [Pseudomonadota bacterium]
MNTAWQLTPGKGLGSLRMTTVESEPLRVGHVRVNIMANSINARDVMVAQGQSPLPVGADIVPLSDGAGVVAEVGEGVSTFAVGDRVVLTFNPAHQNGPFEPHMATQALGELRSGLLSRETVIEDTALVKLPDAVSFEQAACLPCAGVTAWNALFEAGPLLPGQTVLATGTGMVSLMALQLAKAAGMRVGVTTSRESKRLRVMGMGADFTVNYRENPEWDAQVRTETAGRGADVVLETVGPPSIARSVKAASQGGRVMQIGLKGLEGDPLSPLDLLVGGVSVVPVMVGSRAMLERLLECVALHGIRVPIHARFDFDNAPHAFSAFGSTERFGKIVIAAPETN